MNEWDIQENTPKNIQCLRAWILDIIIILLRCNAHLPHFKRTIEYFCLYLMALSLWPTFIFLLLLLSLLFYDVSIFFVVDDFFSVFSSMFCFYILCVLFLSIFPLIVDTVLPIFFSLPHRSLLSTEFYEIISLLTIDVKSMEFFLFCRIIGCMQASPLLLVS